MLELLQWRDANWYLMGMMCVDGVKVGVFDRIYLFVVVSERETKEGSYDR